MTYGFITMGVASATPAAAPAEQAVRPEMSDTTLHIMCMALWGDKQTPQWKVDENYRMFNGLAFAEQEWVWNYACKNGRKYVFAQHDRDNNNRVA